MYKINKKVVIHRKIGTSQFGKKNAKVLPVGASKIGASVKAVKEIIFHSDMMADIMSTPSLLGISNSQQDFTKRVNAYWDSLAVNIPENGKPLEIGFAYNHQDSKKKSEIVKLKKNPDNKEENPIAFTSDKHLANFVEANIPEEDKWKYGVPLEPADYLLWRYCLNYGDVANTYEEINKSPNKIRFYIHNEVEIKKIEKGKLDLRIEASKAFFEAIAKPELVNLYLLILGHGGVAGTMDDLDKAKYLEKIFNDTPQLIIDISKDKQLEKKAFVEECIVKGILRRLPNSNVIVNASDNSPIGNNMQDCIAFLDAEVNVKLRNEIEGRLRSLEQK